MTTLSAAARQAAPSTGQLPPAPVPGPPPPRFPAQIRPPDDPALVERGRQVYGIACRGCHGADLRGGDMGGPNLLRSPVALNDQNGELLGPVVAGSRAAGGMPAVALPSADLSALAAYIRSVLAAGRAQGAPPAGPAVTLNVVVGDAAAGQKYFDKTCTVCHSASGDLQGIASRVVDPVELQNLWVGGGRDAAGRIRTDAPGPRDARATITPSQGAAVSGKLLRIDDFIVAIVLPDGTQRSFRRDGDTPNVVVTDPLAEHRELLGSYTDRDMHDVTAYLVTLR